jgi:4-amino-4-deoxy-L-arabinose transferase-like glycosyltransferase
MGVILMAVFLVLLVIFLIWAFRKRRTKQRTAETRLPLAMLVRLAAVPVAMAAEATAGSLLVGYPTCAIGGLPYRSNSRFSPSAIRSP